MKETFDSIVAEMNRCMTELGEIGQFIVTNGRSRFTDEREQSIRQRLVALKAKLETNAFGVEHLIEA